MCEPTTAAIIAGTLAVGSTAMQYKASQQQEASQQAMYAQNKANAVQAMRDEMNTLGLRRQQEQQAANEELQQRNIQRQQDEATARAMQADSGATGFSMERLIRDINGVADRDSMNISQNRDWSLQQLGYQMSGVSSTMQSRINSVRRGSSVDPWGFAIQGASSALSAGTSAYSAFSTGNN